MAKGRRSETTRGVYGPEPVNLRVSHPEFTGRPLRSRTDDAVLDREVNQLGITLDPEGLHHPILMVLDRPS